MVTGDFDVDNLELYKTIFEQSYNFIVITDANIELPGPKILYVNKAFTQKTGYTMEDLKDQTPRILQGEKTDKKMLERLKKALKNDQFFTASTVNYTKDGTAYDVEWNISPVKDKNKKTKYFVSVQKDITKEVLYEKKLQKEQHQKNLAFRRVVTNDILERIAHHWRQHLSIISASASNILIDYEFNETLQENSKSNIESLNTIINQTKILSNNIELFRQFSNHNTKLQNQKIAIKPFVEDILQLYKHNIENEDIDVCVDIDGDIVLCLDKQKLSEAILPVVDNSIYFLHQEKIQKKKLFIKAYETNSQFVFEIEDNANGIVNENIDKVFEPYFSTKFEKNNTGLGLYIVKDIVEDVFKGEINLSNTSDGLRVVIHIPIANNKI